MSRLSKLTVIFSAVIPGLGQILLKRLWRGVLILLMIPVMLYLIPWSLDNFKIAQVNLGGQVFSWFWLLFGLFWIWNVYDARQVALGGSGSGVLGALLVAVVLYVIAWNVTDVKLERLVTRFEDATKVMKDIANPEFFTIGSGDTAKTCDWACVSDVATGKASLENIQSFQVSDNVGEIFGRMKLDKPPAWMVSLGLAAKDSQVSTFQPGKLVETIAIGLLATIFSTIFALPLSFLAAHNVMSQVRGGTAIYYFMRTLLNIVRAVDTIIWGLLVIVWVGLGPFAGVIALTIHSVAALGKLFSEEIEHIDSGPVEAITASGANWFQVIRYAVVPQVIPSFLGYTLLRWDINMRSATVVGFVAGGGIGFFVLETIRLGAYQVYAAALWAVAVVIILVDYISSRWRAQILEDKAPTEGQASSWGGLRKWAYGLLGLSLFAYCWSAARINLKDLLDPSPSFLRLIRDFLAFDFNPDLMDTVIRQILVTIFQSMLATTFGAILAIPFSFLAAHNLVGRSKFLGWIYYLTRSLFNILRSIEALLYVAIFVFWVGIGPFAGTMALAVTTFALIGKLFSEAIENIDEGPIEAVTATGANRLQMIRYAIVPQIVPPFLSYLIYQWDINIRMATIIGFAGGGGIGLTLYSYFNMLQYHKAGTIVLMIVIVVALMDFASARLRENLV